MVILIESNCFGPEYEFDRRLIDYVKVEYERSMNVITLSSEAMIHLSANGHNNFNNWTSRQPNVLILCPWVEDNAVLFLSVHVFVGGGGLRLSVVGFNFDHQRNVT